MEVDIRVCVCVCRVTLIKNMRENGKNKMMRMMETIIKTIEQQDEAQPVASS